MMSSHSAEEKRQPKLKRAPKRERAASRMGQLAARQGQEGRTAVSLDLMVCRRGKSAMGEGLR